MSNTAEAEAEAPKVNEYVVLVCGLNIREHNRITLDEQLLALRPLANELEVVGHVGDKGSYLVTTDYASERVVDLVLAALVAHRPDLKIPGAALASPAVVTNGLAELATVLTLRYGGDFDLKDHGIRLCGEVWRAGLALPLFPAELPPKRSVFHKIKNAIVLGWTTGTVLVAKREAKNVHWGKTVTDPASSQVRRHDGVVAQLTSRSANVLRDFGRLTTRSSGPLAHLRSPRPLTAIVGSLREA